MINQDCIITFLINSRTPTQNSFYFKELKVLGSLQHPGVGVGRELWSWNAFKLLEVLSGQMFLKSVYLPIYSLDIHSTSSSSWRAISMFHWTIKFDISRSEMMIKLTFYTLSLSTSLYWEYAHLFKYQGLYTKTCRWALSRRLLPPKKLLLISRGS